MHCLDTSSTVSCTLTSSSDRLFFPAITSAPVLGHALPLPSLRLREITPDRAVMAGRALRKTGSAPNGTN